MTVTTLREAVLARLLRGAAVSHVCATTSVPRATVIKLGRQAGLVYRPGADVFVRAGSGARPGTLGALLEDAGTSRHARTRALAERIREDVRTLARTLELEAERDVAAAAPELTSEENARARAWARENGHRVGARGRLPAAVVAAWTAAGRP